MTMRTRSRSSAAAAAAESSNNNERKEEEAPQQTNSVAAALADMLSPPSYHPPPQPQEQQQQSQQSDAVDLTSSASYTRRSSRRSSAASRTAAARTPRRRSSNSSSSSISAAERIRAALQAVSVQAARLIPSSELAAAEAARVAEVKEEKEEMKAEAVSSEAAASADTGRDVERRRPISRRAPRGNRMMITARRSAPPSSVPLSPGPRVTISTPRRLTQAARVDPSLAMHFGPPILEDNDYDSSQDEDYQASEHYFDSEDEQDDFMSDEDEEKEQDRLYEESRQAGDRVVRDSSGFTYVLQEREPPPLPDMWPGEPGIGGFLGGPRGNVQYQYQHQPHHHHHVHDVQRVSAAQAQVHRITRNNIKERMAKKTTPKAKKGKARKGKRRRSSVAVKEEELAALLSQLEGPPSVPPLTCAEVESLFFLASRSLKPVEGASSSASSSSTDVALMQKDFDETQLSPFISLFSDVRSLGASFLRPNTSPSFSSIIAASSAPVSSAAASAFSHTVNVERLLQIELTHGWSDSHVVWSSVERVVVPLLNFVDEWLAGQLPEPPMLVIDDIADEEEGRRAGKKRKGAAARAMSMVSWLQLMNAGIDPATGGDVLSQGGGAVPSAARSSSAARTSIDGGMIDLTDEGEAGQERKDATGAMQLEGGTNKPDDEKMKEGKDERANEVEDEDQPIKLDDHGRSSRSRATQFIIDYHDSLTSSSTSSSSTSSLSSSSSSSEPLSSPTSLSAFSPVLPILTLVRNCVIILLELHMFDGSDGRDLLFQSLRFLPNSTQLQQQLTLYFASLTPAAFQQHVIDIQEHLTLQLDRTHEINESTMGALHILSTLFSAYQLARTRNRVLVEDVSLFTNPTVNGIVDIYGDYHYHFMHKLTSDSHVTTMHQFTWTRHCRFLFTTEVKSEMIRHWLDCHWSAEQVQQAALPTQALTIHLSRQRLVPDLLNALARTRMERGAVELRKPLHVVFSGEEGIDAGGLKKECLSLASDSMFNAQYGMFLWSDETRTFWFNAHCQAHDSVDEMKGEYQLLGTVIGMALLNNVLLPNVVFPPVVYAKLLGLPLSFIDLQTSFPLLHQSLSAILNYDGAEAVEDVFGLTFSIDSEVMGTTQSHPLLPNGETKAVSAANRHEYVRLFTKYQLEDSIATQFDAFARGFWSVLPRHLLAPLLQPVDLELLVCGQREMDFDALEAATKYEGFPVRGRHNQQAAAYQAHLNPFAPAQPVTAVKPTHPVIKHFWSIVHGLNPAQKKQLLHFVTGSSSVPVKGLSEVKLVIANGGSDVRLLPSSRTCFSTLMLPLYKTEAELRKKLLISIEHNTGFGMK